MSGKALVCKLGKHQNIEGADRIVQVDMFGETVITQKGNKEGDLGLLFDCDTQLTTEYARANNMFRHSYLNKNKDVTGYMSDNARVKPIKLKGVKCSALWMPIESLYFISTDEGKFPLVGSEIDNFEGIPICKKYVSPKTKKALNSGKQGRSKKHLAPTFKENFDTDQWGRNQHKVKEGDLVIFTEKLHGTSARCGYLLTDISSNFGRIKKWLVRLFTPKKYEVNFHDYSFVVGSRRVVKSIEGEEAENKNHYYNEDLWTKISKEYFEGKLHKGETVYFEIVGHTPTGELIMGGHSNDKLKSFMTPSEFKNFIYRYGNNTAFTYGTSPESVDNKYKVFVYRITMTNEDGDTIDYSWDQVKTRCNQLNVQHVPELFRGIVSEQIDGMSVKNGYLNSLVEEYTDKPSQHFPNHLKEGICVRIENGSKIPTILKNKNYYFKVLEGIIKESDVVDIEETN